MESSLRKKLKPKANVLGLLKFHRAEHGHDKQEELPHSTQPSRKYDFCLQNFGKNLIF